MLSDAFCRQHRVYACQSAIGEWTLMYQPPLLPWVYLYAARKLSARPNLYEVGETEMSRLLAGDDIVPDVASTLETMAAAESFSRLLESSTSVASETLEDSDAPAIRLINTMLGEAAEARASDIHIETFEHYFQVRYRIDGIMQEVSKGDVRLGAPLISRLKIMAKLDIAERRLPQDGRFIFLSGQREIDIRLSVIPVGNGERAVLRLLDQKHLQKDFQSLGISSAMADALERIIHQPHGIVLVTGPTGSGKSSTLYTSLQKLNQTSRTILTIEDPVEYKLSGVGQTQVNSRIDLTFARGLRALLRQDPDVVMIGEIRDAETARVAVQASLTGHLVFSTLHTNSAIGAVARLADMGIEPWLLSSSLTALLAQRLVRKLCPHCRQAHFPDPAQSRWLGVDEQSVLYRAVGCERCLGRGYQGRTGIYELVEVNSEMRQLIQQRASEAELTACARKNGAGLYQDARQKILEGTTSFEEVLRVVEQPE